MVDIQLYRISWITPCHCSTYTCIFNQLEMLSPAQVSVIRWWAIQRQKRNPTIHVLSRYWFSPNNCGWLSFWYKDVLKSLLLISKASCTCAARNPWWYIIIDVVNGKHRSNFNLAASARLESLDCWCNFVTDVIPRCERSKFDHQTSCLASICQLCDARNSCI